MVGNLRDCGLQQAYRTASVEEQRMARAAKLSQRDRDTRNFPTDGCPFQRTHGTAIVVSNDGFLR
jgi:hypothetical protein